MSTIMRPGVFTRPYPETSKLVIYGVAAAVLWGAAAVVIYSAEPPCMERASDTATYWTGQLPYCDALPIRERLSKGF